MSSGAPSSPNISGYGFLTIKVLLLWEGML